MSQTLDLELNRAAIVPFLTITWLGLFVMLLSLVCSTLLYQSYQRIQHDYSAMTHAISQQDKPQKKVVIQAPVNPVSSDEINQVNQLIDTLSMPWGELLSAIEQSDLADIALLSIEPNPKKQQVLLTGEAKNLSTVLRYIEQLNAQTVLNEVYLQKHSVNEMDVAKPVHFSVMAQWSVAR